MNVLPADHCPDMSATPVSGSMFFTSHSETGRLSLLCQYRTLAGAVGNASTFVSGRSANGPSGSRKPALRPDWIVALTALSPSSAIKPLSLAACIRRCSAAPRSSFPVATARPTRNEQLFRTLLRVPSFAELISWQTPSRRPSQYFADTSRSASTPAGRIWATARSEIDVVVGGAISPVSEGAGRMSLTMWSGMLGNCPRAKCFDKRRRFGVSPPQLAVGSDAAGGYDPAALSTNINAWRQRALAITQAVSIW